MPKIRIIAVALSIVTGFADLGRVSVSAERPNVIVLLADDLGWTDLGCFGSDSHKTPNIDRLAADAMEFTDAYSACTVCSPTRASIMTGKYPARLHLTDFIAGQNRPFAKLKIPDWSKRLELSEVTIAEALQSEGYATAQLGKWHLGPRGGDDAKNYDPTGQGFDVQRMKPPGIRGYFIPERVVKQGQLKSSYLTDYLTNEAVKLVHEWKDQPFVLYFAYHTPHTPIQGKQELVDAYKKSIGPNAIHNNPTYAAMVQSLDESVGRVLAAIEEVGIAERTIIIFASDNGGLSQKFGKPTGFTVNTPLRRGKGSAFEGGVRIPLIVRWPGVTEAGSKSNEPVCTIDFYPTILEMTDVKGNPEHNQTIDGLSLVRLLKNPRERLNRKALYWHYPHYHAGGDSPYGAVRAGSWRLIEFYEDMNVELYDLQSDIGESVNLANKRPGKAEELRAMLHQWRESVGAQMPTPNPDFDAEKARRMALGESLSNVN